MIGQAGLLAEILLRIEEYEEAEAPYFESPEETLSRAEDVLEWIKDEIRRRA